MRISISHPEPGARLGADQCPGIDERGHGLTMAVIHDAGCCQEWETGQAATPARAESFRQAAAQWGTTWPAPPQRPAAGAELQAERGAEADGPATDRIVGLAFGKYVVTAAGSGAAARRCPNPAEAEPEAEAMA